MNERETGAGLAQTPGYRYADVVGDRLFVAGQVPLDQDGDLVGPGDPAAQAVQCLDNLRIVVGVHGFALDDLRRLTVHVVGEPTHLRAAWDAVRAWSVGRCRGRRCWGAAGLGYRDQLVEIDATIMRRQT